MNPSIDLHITELIRNQSATSSIPHKNYSYILKLYFSNIEYIEGYILKHIVASILHDVRYNTVRLYMLIGQQLETMCETDNIFGLCDVTAPADTTWTICSQWTHYMWTLNVDSLNVTLEM